MLANSCKCIPRILKLNFRIKEYVYKIISVHSTLVVVWPSENSDTTFTPKTTTERFLIHILSTPRITTLKIVTNMVSENMNITAIFILIYLIIGENFKNPFNSEYLILPNPSEKKNFQRSG